MNNENWSVVTVDPKNLKQNVQEMIKLILEQERDDNIALDQSGDKFGKNHLKDGTWFLPGSFGNESKIIRKIRLTEDTPIMVLAVSTDNSFAEDSSSKDIASLKEHAKQVSELHDSVEVIIDGTPLNRENKLEMVETDTIPIIFPQNHVYKETPGLNGGETTLVCYAWVIVLKLGIGQHILKIFSSRPASQSLNVEKFIQDVEYQIDILPKSPQ